METLLNIGDYLKYRIAKQKNINENTITVITSGIDCESVSAIIHDESGNVFYVDQNELEIIITDINNYIENDIASMAGDDYTIEDNSNMVQLNIRLHNNINKILKKYDKPYDYFVALAYYLKMPDDIYIPIVKIGNNTWDEYGEKPDIVLNSKGEFQISLEPLEWIFENRLLSADSANTVSKHLINASLICEELNKIDLLSTN